MPRPCPFVSCRYHLGSDAHASIYETRSQLIRLRERPEDMDETCALDVADRSSPRERSLAEIASLLGLSIGVAASALSTATARQRGGDERDEVA